MKVGARLNRKLALDRIALSRRPAHCGAFADERRIVVGDEGGGERARKVHPVPRQCVFSVAVPTLRPSACHPASYGWSSTSVRAGVREAGDRADYRAFASACVSPPTVAMGRCDAPFRCAAPARCGAFVDARRVVAGDGGGPTKADAKRSSRSLGQCGSADCHKRGTRPSNLAWVLVYCCWVREAGARTDKILPNPTGAALS